MYNIIHRKDSDIMCFKNKKNKVKKENKREKNLLLPFDEFSIYKNDRKTYLDKNGKLKQEINYTLTPKKNESTSKMKVVILSIVLAIFIILGVAFICLAYKYDFLVGFFEFADNYLFLGAITLFVFLVFKSKK